MTEREARELLKKQAARHSQLRYIGEARNIVDWLLNKRKNNLDKVFDDAVEMHLRAVDNNLFLAENELRRVIEEYDPPQTRSEKGD